jgi:hypothetical protein
MTYINEERTLPNGVIVKRYSIICSPTVVYSAWEPQNGHHTVTTINGVWMGRIGTDKLPNELEALRPMSQERSDRVRPWIAQTYERGYENILAAFPHLAEIEHRSDMGEITTKEGQL